MTRLDWAKKLGEDVVANHYVFNHNVYDHFEDVGTTSRGTLVEINREFVSADVKVAIGGIIAHSFAGLGGGGKGVFPGVASLGSIEANHRRVAEERRRGGCGYGIMANNVVRFDMEEAAGLTGLDFKVDMVYNLDRRPLEVFAREGVSQGGGTAGIIHNYVQGSVHHNVYGQFGKENGGHLGGFPGLSPRPSPFPKAGRVVYVGQWHSKRDMNPATTWVRSWGETLEILKQEHGEGTKVAVYPYYGLQMPPFPENY
ncbi:MAG: DUF2088 domain-containing protein [Candidatus Bathyarchaeota archaeon]|nr:MAG: DUF2088 domain-containing protein [Candidatus Bathyarchaeota archaeon]